MCFKEAKQYKKPCLILKNTDMKRIIPILILFTLLLASCEKESRRTERTESMFATNLKVKFVFLNKDKKDFIEKDNIKTFPVSYRDEISPITKEGMSEYQETLYFNGNANTLTYNKNIKKNIWNTIVYGFDNVREYKTNIYFEDYENDTIRVNYSFSTDCTGSDYCVEIDNVHYNNKLIYSRGDLEPELIYITKTANETIVKFKND